MNRVYVVEKFVYNVLQKGYKPSEEEIKAVGEILGQPTKRLDVVLDRYRHVFSKYVEKRCSGIGRDEICIYTWNRQVPFKVFPMAFHLTGTILLFKDGEPTEVVAYPIPKALSYAKSAEVSEDKYGSIVPKEVTKRVDGWQLNAYYNPLLNRWMFSTRYVLHNMYFEKGRLASESFESIANPYVYVAHRLAQDQGLYDMLEKFRGWTFVFVLEGPEPAITKPPYPLGEDYENYRLYLIMARDPSGRLYTWSETAKLLNFRMPESVEAKRLSELYRDVVKRLDVRSYIAYVDVGDEENPLLIELESNMYPEAMYVKHLYDAKSAALLVSEGLGEELKPLVEAKICERLSVIEGVVADLKSMLENVDKNMVATASWEIVRTISEFREDAKITVGEITKALAEGNVLRVLKKILAVLLEGKSLAATDVTELLTQFTEKLRQRVYQVKSAEK